MFLSSTNKFDTLSRPFRRRVFCRELLTPIGVGLLGYRYFDFGVAAFMSNSNRSRGALAGNGSGSTPIIELIRLLPGFSGLRFNPRVLIAAVNHLQSVGREESLKTLRDYWTIARQTPEHSNPDNILLIALILFVCPDEQKEDLHLLLGQPDLEEPEDLTLFPLFPLCIYQGIPFCLISGYRIGGETQPPIEYVESCSHHCELRSEPLIPINNPLASVDDFLASESWRSLNPDSWHYRMLRLQALRTVSAIYPISEQDENDFISSPTADEIWMRHRRAFEILQSKWEPTLNDYRR
jgi:hypothetical protein